MKSSMLRKALMISFVFGTACLVVSDYLYRKNAPACYFAQGMAAYAEGFMWADYSGNLRGALYEPLPGDVEACNYIGAKLEAVKAERWNEL